MTTNKILPKGKTLILGGSGFLGGYVANLFGSEYLPVVSPTSRELPLHDSGCVRELVRLIAGCQSLVILAAITPDRNKMKDAYSRNIRMVDNIAKACRGIAQPKYTVYISSDAVYGDITDVIDESSEINPNSAYGEMHARREEVVHSLGWPLAVLRPTMLYGQGDTHMAYGISRFIEDAKKGGIFLFGNGEEYRDYFSVKDASQIIKIAVDQKLTGLWNLASGRSIRFIELAELIQKLMPYPVEILRRDRAQAVSHRHFNVQKLVSDFPEVHICPVEEGIKGLLV